MKKELIERYTSRFTEMANLDTDDTGLSHGTIYISNRNSSHSARIKFYRGSPKKDALNAIVTISNNPEIIHDPFKMTVKEKEEVFKFIKLNYRKLLTFWIRGEELILTKFIKSLKKIND